MVYNSSTENYCGSCQNGYMGLDDYCGCNSTMVPVPAQVRTSSQVIVPVFGTISYNSLTRGVQDGLGVPGISYLPVSRAYRTSCCNTYLNRTY